MVEVLEKKTYEKEKKEVWWLYLRRVMYSSCRKYLNACLYVHLVLLDRRQDQTYQQKNKITRLETKKPKKKLKSHVYHKND